MIKKVGIIGCGAVTQNQYAKVLGMYHDIKVNNVYDINSELANQVAIQLGAESVDKTALIENNDIIIIATPPSTHYTLIKEALKPGKKVICEKPFVGKLFECLELDNLAKERNAELYVAHFRRCFPSVQLARNIVKSGILGQIVGIEAYEGGRFSWKTQSGYVFKDPYGGVLFDTGSHTIDMALFIADLDFDDFNIEVTSIIKDKPEPAHDIQARLKLKFPAISIDFKLKLSRKILLSNKIRITGTNGYIDVPVGLANYLRLYSKNSSTVIYSNVHYEDLMDCFALQFKDMFYNMPDSIYDARKFMNLTKVLETISNT